MIWSVLYIALRRVLELVLLRSRSDESKEPEIVRLRHQLHILRRQMSRAQPKPADHFFLAAASRVLGRGYRHASFVTLEWTQTARAHKSGRHATRETRQIEFVRPTGAA